ADLALDAGLALGAVTRSARGPGARIRGGRFAWRFELFTRDFGPREELPVEGTAPEELVRAAVRDDCTLIEDHRPRRQTQRRLPVRDHDGRAPLHLRLERAVDGLLGVGVDGR